jgi:predicted alpha-1,6-mannanase (GH76 family)
MRRLPLALLVGVTLTLLGVAAGPGRATSTVESRRALASYSAMQRYLYDARTNQFREQLGSKLPAHAWPFSQALAATIAVAALPSRRAATDVPLRLQTLERRFRSGPVYAAWPRGEIYFDDNEWRAEALLDWSELSGDSKPRRRSAALFDAVARAWDASASHPCAGGVFWTASKANRDRNTVTTANAAALAARLYAVTRTPSYLALSRRFLGWLDRCLLAPRGLYWDHIALDGTVETTHWSYNQGIVIGALLSLYQTTGDASALARAEQLGDAALDFFRDRWDDGEPPEFAAIFFRHLLELAAVDGRRDYVDAARGYADRAWMTARDRRTGLFSFSGKTRLLDQSALVQLYALLARHPLTRDA